MALFNFKLAKIEDIHPWGEPDDYSLHWFGLTYGTYYINADSHHLLRYSDDFLNQTNQSGPTNIADLDLRYVDYQIGRFHADLTEILPTVISPLPKVITDLTTPIEYYCQIRSLSEFADSDSSPITAKDIPNDASDWLINLFLDTGYLRAGPIISMYRTNDEIHIDWNNENLLLDGFQPWHEITGYSVYTVDEFIVEITDFHQRLMSEMQTRVKTISQNGIDKISVDIDQLHKDMDDRINWLDWSLKRAPCEFNWTSVANSIQKVKSLYDKYCT